MNHNPISHCTVCNRFVDEPCPWPDCELAGEPDHSWLEKHQPEARCHLTPLARLSMLFTGIMAWYVIFEVIF